MFIVQAPGAETLRLFTAIMNYVLLQDSVCHSQSLQPESKTGRQGKEPTREEPVTGLHCKGIIRLGWK